MSFFTWCKRLQVISLPWHALKIIYGQKNILYTELIKVIYLRQTRDFFITFQIFANSGNQEANKNVGKSFGCFQNSVLLYQGTLPWKLEITK